MGTEFPELEILLLLSVKIPYVDSSARVCSSSSIVRALMSGVLSSMTVPENPCWLPVDMLSLLLILFVVDCSV